MVCKVSAYKSLFIAWALLCSLLTMAGCGYRFVDSGNSIVSGQSIWVAFTRNETTSSTAQTTLRRVLLDESHRMRGMSPAARENEADIVVDGSLRSYSSNAVSYTAADRVREYRLTIVVDLEMRRRGENAPIWRGNLQAHQDYPASDNLALQLNSQETALVAASRIIAQKLLTATEQAY